jgi:type IV pilus assembly protein PilA
VSAVEIAASGRVVVTFNTKVSDGATVVLVPTVVSGSIGWTCASGTLSIQYIPFNCRG